MAWQVGKKIYKGEDWVDEVIGRDHIWGRAAKRLWMILSGWRVWLLQITCK